MDSEEKMKIIRSWGYSIVITEGEGMVLMSVRRIRSRFLIAECSSRDECVNDCYRQVSDELYNHFTSTGCRVI